MNLSPTCTRDVVVNLENGLHLTPSSQIVQVLQKFSCQLLIRKGDKVVDAKSMLDLLTLAAEKGELLRLEASGTDAEDAIAAVVRLFDEGFSANRSG